MSTSSLIMVRHFISFPKSGRTWIRYILYNLNLNHKIKFHHDIASMNNPDKPKLNFDPKCKIEKYSHVDKIVYMDRNPKDVLVSLYHQITGRFKHLFPDAPQDISRFIRDPYFGACTLKKYKDMWSNIIDNKAIDSITINYEQCKEDIHNEVNRILKHYKFKVSNIQLEEAIKKSTYKKMKQVEKTNNFSHQWLRPQNGYPKVRKGKIGSYKEELPEKDKSYLNKIF